MAIVALVLSALLWEGAFLARWHSRSEVWDLDGDGSGETLCLERRTFLLSRGDRELFCTPRSWKVEDYLHGDINGDGEEELLLLVWKRGSYGASKPFWAREENGYSQHIFIYRWARGALRPVWMSSALRPRVKSWSLDDQGRLAILTRGGENTLWAWHTFGLERVDSALIPV